MKLRYILISLFGLALTACSTPDVGANTPTKVSQVMAPVSNDHRPHIVEKFWMKNGHEQVDADLFLANVWDYVTDPTARANLVRRVELSTGLTELSLDQVASILRGEDNRFEVTAATCPDHIRVSDVGNNWGWRKPYVVNNHVEECVSINGDIAIAIGCANPVDNLIGQGLPVTTPSNPTITPTPTPTPCAGCGEQPPVDVCIGGPLDCDGEPPVEKPCVGETEDCGGEKPPVVKEPQPKPEKCTKECNNGWGNGDQEAPGHSLPHNGAENDQTNRRPDPSHGQNAGSNGKGKK